MSASFRVNGHLEIASHGAFVMGDLESGVIHIGDTVAIGDSTTLTIVAVELVDDRSTSTSQIRLRFEGIDNKLELLKLMPAGSRIEILG